MQPGALCRRQAAPCAPSRCSTALRSTCTRTGYTDSTLTASTSRRKGVLVRMPASLKRRSSDETACRGSEPQRRRRRHPRRRASASTSTPTNRREPAAGLEPGRLLRMPEELQGRDPGRGVRAGLQHERRHPRRAVGRARRTVRTPSIDLIGPWLSGRPRKGHPWLQATARRTASARSEDKVRVAIIGVGNCANSLLQGVEYYKDADPTTVRPGPHARRPRRLPHLATSSSRPRSTSSRARSASTSPTRSGRTRTTRSSSPTCRRPASRSRAGMTHDGIGKYLAEVVEKAPGETDDVVGILKETRHRRRRQLPPGRLRGGDEVVRRADPRGRLRDGELHAGLHRARGRTGSSASSRPACRSSATTSSRRSARRSRTACSRRLFRERGVHLDKTMQLNVGGNSDFLNMLERERLESKKISKTNAVTSMLDYDIGEGNVHVGPSDYVPWLTDRKWAYIRMEGSSFGDVPLNVELKLEVWDSPNSAGHRDRRRPARQARAEQRRRRRARGARART